MVILHMLLAGGTLLSANYQPVSHFNGWLSSLYSLFLLFCDFVILIANLFCIYSSLFLLSNFGFIKDTLLVNVINGFGFKSSNNYRSWLMTASEMMWCFPRLRDVVAFCLNCIIKYDACEGERQTGQKDVSWFHRGQGTDAVILYFSSWG